VTADNSYATATDDSNGASNQAFERQIECADAQAQEEQALKDVGEVSPQFSGAVERRSPNMGGGRLPT